MSLLEKIETLLNALLIKLGELIWKAVPGSVKNLFARISALKERLIAFIKSLPSLILQFLLRKISGLKTLLASINFKQVLSETYQKASEKYKANAPSGAGKFGKILMTPVFMMGEWLRGLSPVQALLLMSFTGASILAVIGIGYSGQKLANNHFGGERVPASAEEVLYERPDYYKKETRHFDIANLRLPVYVAQVNELRTVDIDFTATLSNRQAKQFLEKHEFQLRDFLILQIEPSVATFPLEEEGKEIIRKKLWVELNDFLKEQKMEGEVVELKITYVLAN